MTNLNTTYFIYMQSLRSVRIIIKKFAKNGYSLNQFSYFFIGRDAYLHRRKYIQNNSQSFQSKIMCAICIITLLTYRILLQSV